MQSVSVSVNDPTDSIYEMRLELPTAYQHFIFLSRYSRWLEHEKRREHWYETVRRYVEFFRQRFPQLGDALYKEIYESILTLKILPSMRCLWTAGKALDKDNAAGYNCAFVSIDHQRTFSEIFYLLMVGAGVGFSVERQDVTKLPVVPDELYETDTKIIVKDSKLGWVSGLNELVSLLFSGRIPKWDLSAVRPAGSRLKTFGGRASGPIPLDELFRNVVKVFLRAKGRKLNSIECHSIVTHIASAVLVGGVRRSALISLSNLSDDRMRSAKSGQWWVENPNFALANNSVAYTEKPDIGIFMKEWLSLYESKSGERGIFNRIGADKHIRSIGLREPGHSWGTNPCGEVILRSNEFCNLSTVIVRPDDTMETFLQKFRLASILGTLQSSLTNFRFLNKTWKKNCEEERLLGVSMTGVLDHPFLSKKVPELDGLRLPAALNAFREQVRTANAEISESIGINPSVSFTSLKPEGCGDLETKVKTTEGVKSFAEIFIESSPEENFLDLKPGTWLAPTKDIYIYNENGKSERISELYINGLSEIYEIEDTDGNIYRFTENHKLKTSEGWKEVKNLSISDVIQSY